MKTRIKIRREDLEKALGSDEGALAIHKPHGLGYNVIFCKIPDTIEVDAEVDISVMKMKNEEAK